MLTCSLGVKEALKLLKVQRVIQTLTVSSNSWRRGGGGHAVRGRGERKEAAGAGGMNSPLSVAARAANSPLSLANSPVCSLSPHSLANSPLSLVNSPVCWLASLSRELACMLTYADSSLSLSLSPLMRTTAPHQTRTDTDTPESASAEPAACATVGPAGECVQPAYACIARMLTYTDVC